MTKNLFKSIIRNLWRNRVTSAINVLGLTLGLSSCLFLYVFLKYENTFDKNQPKADHIYRVNITKQHPNTTLRHGNTEPMLVKAIRNEFDDLEAAIQVIGPRNALITIRPGDTDERIFEEERILFFADSLFLKYFEYEFIAGNPLTALDDQSAIVLSSILVEKYYPQFVGREMDLLGKEIELFDSQRVAITGVIRTPPGNTNFPFKALVSSEVYYKQNDWDRDNWGNIAQGMTFVVLNPNQRPEDIEKRFPTLVTKYRSEDAAKTISYSLLNLKELHNTETWGPFVGTYTMPVYIEVGFIVIGLFILLSACINFINLQTAQSINRAKEVGIKKVLGSSRTQLVFQFLLETTILTSVAFLFGLWITEIMLNEWNELLSIARVNVQMDSSVLLVGVAMILIVTLISGIYPAFKLSSFQPSEVLKNNLSKTSNKKGIFNFRQILVILQFTISQILVIGTIVIASQMDYFINADLGFTKEGMLQMKSFSPDDQQIDRLVQGLERIPEISSFSLCSGPPMHGGYNTSFLEVGHEDRGMIKTENKFIDHRYLDQFDLKLIAGRNFRPDEYDDKIKGFIVNEALVKLLDVSSPEDVIGKKLRCYGYDSPIIGVVKDFHNRGLNSKIDPVIMFCRRTNVDVVDVKLADQNVGETLTKLRPLWLDIFPKRTFSSRSVNDYIKESYIVEGVMFKTIRLFAIIAIIIGCLGLYGLVSFMAIQKTKEIGIRKALGASYMQILSIFSKNFFLLILVAFAIALPLSYQIMDLWLNNYAYHVSLTWSIFALGLLVTLILTIITVGQISWKAAKANPAETLQYE